MTVRGGMLEEHTLVIRDGRILEVLPHAAAAVRYLPTVRVERPAHALLPGLVNAQIRAVPDGTRATDAGAVRDQALLGIARMLRTGTTCCCTTGYFPEASARLVAEQGMRALIGIPIAEAASPWAKTPGEYLTRALNFRDEFRGHPALTTAFAPLAAAELSDATFERIATLANELDASLVMSLHESHAEIDSSLARYGRRPLERMHALGLLTPALTAVHMNQVVDADIALAQRGGIAITLCPQASLRDGNGPPPVTTWASSGLRVGVGTGAAHNDAARDLWQELRLLALLAAADHTNARAAVGAWDALAAATRGGAAALGLDAETGTLEPGKWADLCCVDLRAPAMLRTAAIDMTTQLTFNGAGNDVGDVWVAGRQLVNEGSFTRLDWAALAARIAARSDAATTGERP